MTKLQVQTFEGMKNNDIRSLFGKYENQIIELLPKAISPQRLFQVWATVLSRNPNLAECSQSSFVGAMMQTAAIGLDPTPQLGLCYYTPRWNGTKKCNEIQFIIGYQGYIALAKNSGDVSDVYAQIVFEKDEFDFQYGTKPFIHHKPSMATEKEKGEKLGAYAVWFLTGNSVPHIEWMPMEDIEKVKKKSDSLKSEKGAKFSPWNEWPDLMARKSVIRRSQKYVPLSVFVSRQLATDETFIHAEDFKGKELNVSAVTSPYEEVVTETKPEIVERLDKKAKAIKEKDKQPEPEEIDQTALLKDRKRQIEDYLKTYAEKNLIADYNKILTGYHVESSGQIKSLEVADDILGDLEYNLKEEKE